LREVLAAIGRDSPELLARVIGEAGGLQRHVNVFVNDEDVRFRELLETPVRDGDQVAIVPAIAGGR
jgi:molybdopterin converting factor small subunit